ncbi:MAG: BglG family transcription antiterminator [Candidatus Izemoplasmataceae bacterium]
MRKREKEILSLMLQKQRVAFEYLLEKLDISRRTLYYDIKNINEMISDIGLVTKQGDYLYLEGNQKLITSIIQENKIDDLEKFLDYSERKKYILWKIFSKSSFDTASLVKEMYVSEATIIATLKQMKEELSANHITLFFKDGYHLSGEERAIRDLYLMHFATPFKAIDIDERIENFNKKSQLELADFSKGILSRFLNFIEIRIEDKNILKESSMFSDALALPYYNDLKALFNVPINAHEQNYLGAFISSLSSLNQTVSQSIIHSFVEKLIFAIENNLMIVIEQKDELKKGIARHLYSAYNRIKYEFPIYNPLLEEIKIRFEPLFRVTRNLFVEKKVIPELSKIRDEEIAFIVSYLGAYIAKDNFSRLNPKVLVVCPNGMTVSKTIEYQLEQYFPQLKIISTVPVSKIHEVKKPYDYIISTVEIEDCKHAIIVNPILRRIDLDEIASKIYQQKTYQQDIDIGELLDTVREYAVIKNEDKLRKALYDKIYKTNKLQGGMYMLKDLLLKEHIHIQSNHYTWEELIKVAAQPLLEKGSIENRYVDAMIKSVKKNGPYIVIDDYIALAHARPEDGVNQISMALLKVNESVDLLGEMVKVVVILAATDNTKHIEALASLTELFMNKENKEKILNANTVDEIHELVKQYS